jgi:ferredoxin
MSSNSSTLETYLDKFTEADWLSTIESLLPSIHEVDRTAVQVWFRFYPLELFRYLEAAEDREKAQSKMAMLGRYELKEQIDSSHHFLYGHRFWKETKEAVEKEAESFTGNDLSLGEIIKSVAITVAERKQVDRNLTTAIGAAGLMTLVQSGLDNLKAAPGTIEKPSGLLAKSPDKIVAARAEDDSQGIFGFLKTINKKYSIVYDETRSDGRFPIISDEEIASASAKDQSRNWKEMDERCWEGVVPVECTSASCGTCWVGVIGGQEKLSAVSRRERRAMKTFGYNQPEDERPFMRLACQAEADGNATIVIPPWNAVFGKKVYNNVEEVILEPNTTSAKVLRETIASATVAGSKED